MTVGAQKLLLVLTGMLKLQPSNPGNTMPVYGGKSGSACRSPPKECSCKRSLVRVPAYHRGMQL